MATGSWAHREDAAHLRHPLAVVQAIGEHAQTEHLHASDRFFAGLALGQYTWESRHLCQPATVFFRFDFNGQRHDGSSVPRAFRLAGIPAWALQPVRCI